jgi:hypothetical protein
MAKHEKLDRPGNRAGISDCEYFAVCPVEVAAAISLKLCVTVSVFLFLGEQGLMYLKIPNDLGNSIFSLVRTASTVWHRTTWRYLCQTGKFSVHRPRDRSSADRECDRVGLVPVDKNHFLSGFRTCDKRAA